MKIVDSFLLIILFSLLSCVSKEDADGLAPGSSGGGSAPQVLTPALGVLTGNQNFPSTNVGSSSSISVIVANTGSDSALVGTPGYLGNDVVITSDLCGNRTLASGQTCTIILTFSPTTVASQMTELTIPYRGVSQSAPHSLVLSIGAVSSYAQPRIASSPSSWDFDQVVTSQTVTKIFTVSNSLAGVASFQASTVSGVGYSISADACSGNALNLNQLCTVSVSFSPVYPSSSLGVLTLNFEDSMGVPSTKTVSLSGYGNVPQPVLTLSPSPYNFNDVATNASSSHMISVSNNTASTATTGMPTISGTGFSILSSTCDNRVLSALGNCTINVRFAPSSTGIKAGTLTVPYTSTQAISYTSTLSLGGTGVVPSVGFAFSGFTGDPAVDSTALVSTGMTLRWTAQPAASYYVITRTGGSTGTVVTPHIFPTTKNSYNVSGLDPGATYQFKINAFDAAPTSDGNNTWVTVTTPSTSGATFNGWIDLAVTGSVFTDITAYDNARSLTGGNRVDRNLSPVSGFSSSEVNVGSDSVAFSNYHSLSNIFSTGEKFKFYGVGTPPAPLSFGDTVYVIKVSDSVYKLATSYANAVSNTAIDITSAGVGNFTLQPSAKVKLSWEDFTIAPSGVAASHNVYRSTTSGSGFVLVGNTATAYYTDQEVSDETTYYYKVIPILSAAEVPVAPAVDGEIKVYVPPQNMIFAHRWIMNRETCTSLLGFTFSTGVDRSNNYSCAFTWGQGYAPDVPLSEKSKWDMGYSIVSDRWRRGCKPSLSGPIEGFDDTTSNPGEVFTYGTWDMNNSQRCLENSNGSFIDTTTSSHHVNSPGFIPVNMISIGQSGAYASCQNVSISGVGDGNGNNKLRLPRKHEMVALRAFNTSKYVNKMSVGLATQVRGGVDPALNGSCKAPFIHYASSEPGITNADPAVPYAFTRTSTRSGSFVRRNCKSIYDLSDYGEYGDVTSDQIYCGPTNGSCIMLASGIDDGANLLEDFAFDGTMGVVMNVESYWTRLFTTDFQIPMLGLATHAVDTSLGSVAIPSGDGLDTFVNQNSVRAVFTPRAFQYSPFNNRESWSPGTYGALGHFRCVGVIP